MTTNLGDEFTVNISTTGNQNDPVVTPLSNGGFVVTWTDFANAFLGQVRGQVFDSSGERVGAEFAIGTGAANSQSQSSVAALSDGRFIVTWLGSTDQFTGIGGQIFDAAGDKIGNEIFVGDLPFLGIWEPNVAATSDGFTIAFTYGNYGGSGSSDIYLRRFDDQGQALGDITPVHVSGTIEKDPVVAFLPDGRSMVAWNTSAFFPFDGNIIAQMFDSGGHEIGSEFQVNAGLRIEWHTTASLAVTESSSKCLVTWNSQFGVVGQFVDFSGSKLGNFFSINPSIEFLGQPDSIALANDQYLITWAGSGTDGYDIFGQIIAPSGQKIGSPIVVNTSVAGDQSDPSIAQLSDGRIVVVWVNKAPNQQHDLSGSSIHAQIISLIDTGPVNQSPVANPDEQTTSEDVVLAAASVLTNDDPDINALDVVAVRVSGLRITDGGAGDLDGLSNGSIKFNTVAGGTATIKLEDGTFSYAQNGVFNELRDGERGTDSFEYQVTDRIELSGFAAVALAINGENDLPVVSETVTSSATEDAQIYDLDLIQFASDPDRNDVLHVGNVTGLTSGLTLNGETLHIDPNAYNSLAVGELKKINVGYDIVDGLGGSIRQTATITIYGENDAPIAEPDTAIVQKGKATSTNALSGVLANDDDPDQADSIHLSAVNGVASNVGHAIHGAYGTLTLNSDGSYTYVADNQIASLNNLSSVQDKFSYTIEDAHGGISNSTLTVTVQKDRVSNIESVISISALDANKNEGDSGNTTFTFSVTRVGDLSQATKVDWEVRPNESSSIDVSDFAGSKFPGGTVTFKANDADPQIITVNVKGDMNYETTENFVVTLKSATNGHVDSLHSSALGHIQNDDFKTSEEIFNTYRDSTKDTTDGELAFLATLSKAAYYIHEFNDGSSVERIGAGFNDIKQGAYTAFNELSKMAADHVLKLLNPSDFEDASPLSLRVTNDSFAIYGLLDGTFTNQNAGALIARSEDSLFISFRGTNDNDEGFIADAAFTLAALVPLGALPAIAVWDANSTPDMDHWIDLNNYGWPLPDEGMMDHYNLLRPLINAIDTYVNDRSNHISHVYVTGHSLGAAMAQEFMWEHQGPKYDAILFGDPGLDGFGATSLNDPRITSFRMDKDPVSDTLGIGSIYPEAGDIFVIKDQQGFISGSNHDMSLYLASANFLASTGFQERLPIELRDLYDNNKQDKVTILADVTKEGEALKVDFANGQIIGTEGPDIILGGGDSDVLIGLLGDDYLSGGPGNDTLVFDGPSGKDTIIDFHPGEDKVQFARMFSNPDDLLAHTTDVHGNAVISYFNGNNSVTLLGISKVELHTNDFIIV